MTVSRASRVLLTTSLLFLAGCAVMLVWLDWRLALFSAAIMPLSLWTLVRYRARAMSVTYEAVSVDVGGG